MNEEEIRRVLFDAADSNAMIRVTKKVAQAALLGDPIMKNGKLWEAHVNHVAAGIYDLWMKEKY